MLFITHSQGKEASTAASRSSRNEAVADQVQVEFSCPQAEGGVTSLGE